jgi:magnesium transporter
VDVYGDHIFAVMYALRPQSDRRPPVPHEVALFANDHVVVTVRTEEIEELNVAAGRWAERRTAHDDKVSSMLVYTIADSLVDGYFPCMDALAEDIEDLEMRMFADQRDSSTLEEIFRLKRGLLESRRVIAPTRDVFNVFVRRELPFFGEESVFYFQDVYDHVIRITDTIDADRDVLSSAIDVHLSLASNRMNQTVRTLTVASIILMSMTLVAGIYGMNFRYIPELRWHYGYFIALTAMAVIGGGELAFFRKINWW